MYKTVAEVRTLLEKVLNNTQYTGIYDDPLKPMEQPIETHQLQVCRYPRTGVPPLAVSRQEL